MIPADHDIVIYRDRDYSKTFVVKDGDGVVIDLTGYEAAAQIRPLKDSATLTQAFTVTVTPAEGKVVISLTDVQTLALTAGKYWWDLVMTDPSGLRWSYVEGTCFVKGSVTRA